MLTREETPVIDHTSYLRSIIEAARRSGLVSATDYECWQESFSNHTALHDPRVQAFCSTANEKSLAIAYEVTEKEMILRRYLEVLTLEIRRIGAVLCEHMTFAYRGTNYVVLTEAEEKTNRVGIRGALAGLSRPEVRRRWFGGFSILEWAE